MKKITNKIKALEILTIHKMKALEWPTNNEKNI